VSRLLRRTALEPGGSVRGEVWMPSWPLRHVVSMAAAAPPDYQVTLHTPSELGGQQVMFSVAIR